VSEQLLFHKAEFVSSPHHISGFSQRGEIPGLCFRDCIKVDPTVQEKAALLGNFGEGILEAVKYLAEHPRSQFNREEFSGKLHGLTDS